MATRNTCFLKIIILGHPNVGKTALIRRYVKGVYSPVYRATVGADFCSKTVVIDNCKITMQIWDTAGQERFYALGRCFYRGADACILAFDVTDPLSFRKVEKWREQFLSQANPRDPERFPFVLVGNKVDLDCRQILAKEAEQWCKEKNMPYFETSAKNNFNVGAAFKFLAGKAVTHAEVRCYDPAVVNPSTADQVDQVDFRGTCNC